MKRIVTPILVLAALLVTGIAIALGVVASSPPKAPPGKDVFGFEGLRKTPPASELAVLKRYTARDGEDLAYRLYEATSANILIFIHGSSYHGGGYHELAASLSSRGMANVVLPNMRGHYQSGVRRGDIDYVGQYEDDLHDLIVHIRTLGLKGPITLGGHSSGGGLVLRFAGSAYGSEVARFAMLSPIIPVSASIRAGTAGGWSNLHFRRLLGLVFLNAIGVSGFNSLPVVEFNKPAKYRDGTETLAYSYQLNTSYHPRYRYAKDVAAVGDRGLILIGERDEAIDAVELQKIFTANAPKSEFHVLPGVNHFGIFGDQGAIDALGRFMTAKPAG